MRTASAFQRGLPGLALLLGLGANACSPTDGMVAGPRPGPGSAPTTGVEGTVFLTHDVSSENVAVLLVWKEEVEEISTPGGGIEAEKLAVPVAEGELPIGARVAIARTDAAGYFIHPREDRGAVTLRVGALPDNCRPPRDQIVQIEPGSMKQVQVDVLCYGPKAPPPL